MESFRRLGLVTLLICALLNIGVNAKLKRGRYQHLETFCNGVDTYTIVPWDCTGYVHCANQGTQGKAYWISCPANLYYSLQHKTCMWPANRNKPCPPLKDVVKTYCKNHTTARFQSPDHCAQYYDCTDASFSPGLGPFLKECPFPELYNTNSKMCAHPDTVRCEDRYTPLTKCDYVQHAGADCTAETTPGCAGQPNGNNPYRGRLLTEYYLVCQNNQTVATKTCNPGLLFDPVKMICTTDIDPLSVEIFCAANPGRKLANPGNCAQYFDCALQAGHPQLGRHQGECVYPKLFSTHTSRCEDFQQVQCRARREPKAPCQYVGKVGSKSMEACRASHHSCVGLEDGSNPVSAIDLSSTYIMCLRERTVDVKTCPSGSLYDPVLRNCNENVEMGLVARQCQQTPTALLPDPENCARYYNCSLTTARKGFKKYQTECDYPLLFNINTLACDDFTQVQCGARFEPKAPCDYISTTTKCTGPLCSLPCLERSPSCVGRPDGNNTYPERELSAFYMTCLGERTVSVGICRFGVYDPLPRMCMSEISPGSVEAYCAKPRNRNKVVPHYANCARYYNCSSDVLVPGQPRYLSECAYPSLFNMEVMACGFYKEVDCSFRFKPTEPCEYMRNRECPPGQPQCQPCMERLPSCTGLENGNNTFVGRDNFFIICENGRTMDIGECPSGPYDPVTRACKEVMSPEDRIRNPVRYCTANPTAIFHNTLICNQYYDCRQQVTMLGNFKIECPYPQLFDIRSKSCQPYDKVKCGTRTVPLEPCEYESNLRCPDVGSCTPCRQRYESCRGNPDGNYAVMSSRQKFKVCRDERTIDVKDCPMGADYDVTRGSCDIPFDPRNPTVYCTAKPTAVIPNPDNCAQFYDCRNKNTPFGNYLHECPYPELFSPTDRGCHYFESKKVKCGTRPEPKAPCDYLQNKQCNKAGVCEPCELIRPSCVGLTDGNNTFPGQENKYIVCINERTAALNTCPSGVFDVTTRQCGVPDFSNPDVICSLRPQAIFPHPTRCAQYYDCRVRNSALGKYVQECPYPSLFESTSLACQDFTTVTCGDKYEPIGPCDYLANSCTGKGPKCTPCSQRFVSCVGRPDGNNSYIGQDWTAKYVMCQKGRTVGDFVCDSGYFDPTRRVCAGRLSAESIKRYCQINPDTIIANPLNCAQYFDCSATSVATNTFLRECPYPMLFSDSTSVCTNFTDVTCGTRMEPTEPCQYLQNLCNRNMKACRPCQERKISCTGLPDGDNAIPGQPESADFVICRNGRTIDVGSCSKGTFDPIKRSCGVIADEDAATKYCKANPTEVIPHPTNCAQYYDCRKIVMGSYLRECRYPQLYDVGQKFCRNYTDVKCGTRYEPVAPCEYLQTRCLPDAKNCTPCAQRLPNCVGLNDGNHPYPGRPNSQYYIKCDKGRTTAVDVCQVSLYDPIARECSNTINADLLDQFCKKNPTVIIPDPLHCSRYYNCSDPSTIAGLNVPYKQECTYPRLFGYGATNCQLFAEVDCGKDRFEPQAPCEYVENQCFNATCEKCEVNYPSCVGYKDGSNIFPGRESTEYYMVCYKNRTVAVVTCKDGIYSHGDRACIARGPPIGGPPTGGRPGARG